MPSIQKYSLGSHFTSCNTSKNLNFNQRHYTTIQNAENPTVFILGVILPTIILPKALFQTASKNFPCQSYRIWCKTKTKTKLLYLCFKNSSYCPFFLLLLPILIKYHALFCSTVTKLLEPTLRNVERLPLYPMTTKWFALMNTAKLETKHLHVTLTQNCPASVPQMVLVPLNPGETIPMWFVVGFYLHCSLQLCKFLQHFIFYFFS